MHPLFPLKLDAVKGEVKEFLPEMMSLQFHVDSFPHIVSCVYQTMT